MKKIIVMTLIVLSTVGIYSQTSALKELTFTVGQLKIQNGDLTAVIAGKEVPICDPNWVIVKAIKPVILVDYQKITVQCINGNWIITKFDCVC